METRKYYEAYDDRYVQVHKENLQWFSYLPSPIVSSIIHKYQISETDRILELGCGEGRDAKPLLDRGFDLLATDISPAAIRFCREKFPEYEKHFAVMNCITDRMEERFSFIYAVAVIHMLLLDEDRDGFYQFLRHQLTDNGIALICSMGDGHTERSSDISTAFELQERIHEPSGKKMLLAGTSYRGVSMDTFKNEIRRNGLKILESGLTEVEPDYYTMIYAVVKKG